ncbi:MAG: HD domain-containing protein [Clostridiales bacterium]|nr:HD domain-containing protein [Clostridiales bacterium]
MKSPEAQTISPEKAKALHHLAVDMVIRLNIVLKSARIYEPNNLLFERQVSLLFRLIQQALTESGQASLVARQSTIFFNTIRLKYGFSNYQFFKFILEEFKRKEVGGIRFEPGLAENDLKIFAMVLAKTEEKPGQTYEKLVAELSARGVSRIALEKILPSGLAPSREKYAAKVFFLGLTHLEEVFEAESGQEKIKLGTTRRLMQSIFNHIVDNESFVQGLTNIKNFHEYTLNHSMNVCILAIALGRRLGLDRNELVDLGISAFFHDFGKLDTPKEILEKPGKLDDREREIIERHPYQGAGKLVQFRELRKLPLHAVHVALEHHIKEDRSGYPRPFKKQSVNLFSKIVKIVDFFDAITTKRVYRTKVFTREEALSLMLEQSGKEFHPLLLREFVKMMGVYPVGTLIALNTGELGLVVENNPDPRLLLRPQVKLITDPHRNKVDGAIIDLSKIDPLTNRYSRTIVKTLDPEKYDVRVADYFVAQVQ